MTQAEMDAARDAVAYGGIKYADLSHTRTQVYGSSSSRDHGALDSLSPVRSAYEEVRESSSESLRQ